MIKLAGQDEIYFNRIRKDSASRGVRSVNMRIRNFYRIICSYSKIYFLNWPKYSFLLYASRIGGTFKFYLYKFANLK
jgi:hypothetical protein